VQDFLPAIPKIVLALSGGPDSIFLGEHLTALLPEENIIVAHFDHQLRKDSHLDRKFCENWAQKKGCLFVSDVWKSPHISEEKGRTARYTFLSHIVQEHNADAIALGTHGDDEAETIMFHFLRGSGLSGLSGIKMFDSHTKRFRPLLRYTKAEIKEYLKENNIPFRIDSSNLDSHYARNFLRNEIFPQLQIKFPGFAERVRRQAVIFDRAHDFICTSAKDFLQKHRYKIPRKMFTTLHSALQSEVLRKLFFPKSLYLSQIESLQNFISSSKSGKKMHIGNKEIQIYTEYFFVEEKNDR
jgi:tRNA(Ile)-lysidine synthase